MLRRTFCAVLGFVSLESIRSLKWPSQRYAKVTAVSTFDVATPATWFFSVDLDDGTRWLLTRTSPPTLAAAHRLQLLIGTRPDPGKLPELLDFHGDWSSFESWFVEVDGRAQSVGRVDRVSKYGKVLTFPITDDMTDSRARRISIERAEELRRGPISGDGPTNHSSGATHKDGRRYLERV